MLKSSVTRLPAISFIIVGAGIIALALCNAATAGGFLKADGQNLTLNGKPYRAIGANAPDFFVSYAGIDRTKSVDTGKARQKAIDSVIDAQKSGIAFFRFWASGFWPADMKMYLETPDLYWKKMDEAFDLCRKHNIKIVASIFWNAAMWPMLCEEDKSAIIDPNSKTYKAMRKYARELVSRYKDDTNVLMWEITNEAFFEADVQMDGREAPEEVAYLPEAKLKKKKWNSNDSISSAMLMQFYIDITSYIKSIDPNHLIASGDAGVRDTSWSLKQSFPDQEWTRDNFRQHVSNLLISQPEPLDVFSLHLYGSGSGRIDWEIIDVPILEYNARLIRAVHATRTPLYIGEFGQSNPSLDADENGQYLCDFIDVIEKEGVALASVWAWYFPWQPENDLRGNAHPKLIKRIAKFNCKYAQCEQ